MQGYGRSIYKSGLLLALGLLVAACHHHGYVAAAGHQDTSARQTSDLYIVDCLLPGQLRALGNMKYLSARRAVKTTSVDCRIRGGEYVAYDRADYRTALKVWLPQAEQGDPEAQNYVGEIFEKGIAGEPDYHSASIWYQRSAVQGFSRAQVNLGYLFEKGLGVSQDTLAALNWYRRAARLSEDELVLSSDAARALLEQRQALSGEVESATKRAAILQKQISGLREEVSKLTAAPEVRDSQDALSVMQALYNTAAEQRDQLREKLDNIEVAYRSFSGAEVLLPELERHDERVIEDINFGRYYALLIGNQDYLFLDDLRSAKRDTERLKEILERQYGFSAVLLVDANEKNILNTINDFYDEISEDDNLLIYYAGHGNISVSERSRTERGYWLPVDAGREDISNWINTAVISDHLDRLKARSVLVISDSCYAGYLGSAKSPLLFGLSGSSDTQAAIQAGLSRRARVVISSGGLKPVLDGQNTSHSIFAGALIEALSQNRMTLKDSSLFAQLSVNVQKRSGHTKAAQAPEMKPVRDAGHEGGAFYFVPASKSLLVSRP